VINLDSNPEDRFSVRLFFTAIPSALRCPMSSNSYRPRLTPVAEQTWGGPWHGDELANDTLLDVFASEHDSQRLSLVHRQENTAPAQPVLHRILHSCANSCISLRFAPVLL